MAQTTVTADAPADGQHAYVDGFCLVVAGGYVDDDYAKFLGSWHARPASSSETEAARPGDANAPGQLVRFSADPAAPAVIVDPHRNVCSLLWPSARPSPAALAELAKDRPPVGQKGAPTPWRHVVDPARVGPPKPPRFILFQGGSEASGVCAERRDDLRRHDGSTVSMLQFAPCRLAAGETATMARMRSGLMAMAALAAVLCFQAAAAAQAPDPAPTTTSQAVIATLEAVCRPSTEADVSPAVSATRLRYPSVEVPPNLPTGKPLHAWAAPGPGPGRIYVLDGGLPESAQAGCIVAVYDEIMPMLPGDIQARLVAAKAGFAPNPTLAVSNSRQTVTRFDRRKGDVVTSVLIIQPKAAAADAPSAVIAISRVDYGWLAKFGG